MGEMMICYMGMHCRARQYMSRKPQNKSIKVWCLVDTKLCYIYNFVIYYGRNGGHEEVAPVKTGESILVHGITMNLMEGNPWKGHCIVMENYFTSAKLFEELLRNGTYAMGTMHINYVGIPQEIQNTRDFNRQAQGTLAWKMHKSLCMASVIWKDKRLVVFLSTHALPIDFRHHLGLLFQDKMVQFGWQLAPLKFTTYIPPS